MSAAARAAAERAARTAYGRLVALIAVRTRDVAAAEDALADAFAAALASWGERGVPDAPEAWLLTAARRAAGKGARGRAVRDAAQEAIVMLQDEAAAEVRDFPDERLKLLFVCAHPAIDPAVRTPLMLQTVLGLDAARIAAAFLVAPATMGQRLVRAKTKIRAAGIAFAVPDADQLPLRTADVLGAIYAAFGTGWDALPGADSRVVALRAEAIWLGRLMVDLCPADPEAKGLLALMLYCEARAAARRDASGAFVPLSRQDVRLWDGDAIREAEALLTSASAARRFGRFQCEAAIQSVHSQSRMTGTPEPAALVTLYDLLARHAPTLGNLVARAAARGEAGRAADGLAMLDALPPERIAAYQPYWVTRAHLLALDGQGAAARVARTRAIGLTEDPALRAYLMREDGDSASKIAQEA